MATEKRLIDANALAAELTDDRDQDCNRYMYWYQKKERDAKYDFAIERINEAQTVDAVEVVHGSWVNTEFGTLCTHCHRCFDPDFEIRRTVCRGLKHCPDCGADMRERKDK